MSHVAMIESISVSDTLVSSSLASECSEMLCNPLIVPINEELHKNFQN